MFDKIREKYRQNGKMVEKWEDYVDRTSKYATLKAAKDNMVNQIEQSRARQVLFFLKKGSKKFPGL